MALFLIFTTMKEDETQEEYEARLEKEEKDIILSHAMMEYSEE